MAGKSSTKLKVLNPRGEREAVSARGISPRVTELEGKRIGLYWNGKQDGDYFWDTIEGLLKKKFPTAKVLRYNGPGDLGEAMAARMSKEVDTFLYGVGD
ncbi:MAG TPA: hypothetical protein G4O18_05325 [Dehalococcoidia bacterium]|nr:hypothetical protein [Dehalococcoidia bacterium]